LHSLPMKASCLAALLLLTPPSILSAADSWIEVRSPHFTVLSNAGAGTARNIAWQFEQFRSAIETGWPWARVQLDRPLLILAAKDESTMRSLAPRYWERNQIRPASVFATSVDRHYIALRADVQAEESLNTNPYRPAYWSYATLTLESAFARGLPLWFRQGLSEVLSNTIVNSGQLEFGRPMPGYLEELQHGRYNLRELFAIGRDSPVMTRESDRQRFDAQCWTVMQYLLYGASDREVRAKRVNDLARLILSGTPSATAVEQVFGSVDALDAAYQLYIGQGIFRYAVIKVDTKIAAKDFQVRPLPPAGASAARGSFHAAMARPVEARTEIEQIKKLDAQMAAAYEIEAKLLDVEHKDDEAREAYAKAVELNSDNYYMYFRLASLTRRPGIDSQTLEAIQRWLSRAVSLNETFAPAAGNLATVLLQLNRPAEAVDAARRAVILEPDETFYRLSLAEGLWRNSQRDEALKEARTAVAIARTDAQRRAAQSLIDSFASRGR